VFFAYIGFDAVSTAAQEAKNPQRDMPLGILGSLAICTVLYILVSGLLTAIVPYKELDVPAPIATGMERTGVTWGSFLVNIGSVAGLGSVMLVMLLGQSRVFYSMAHDGLLWTWAGKIHSKFRTPYISTMIIGTVVAIAAGTLPLDILDEMVSIGTLLAFVIVCAAVWLLRIREPELPRAFKTPAVPLVPILGIVMCAWMMIGLQWQTWLRLVVWLVIGMFVYFTYGIRHSKVQRRLRGENVEFNEIPEELRTRGH
jgi:APA family basic amino acid/polyamine antiporter